MKEKKVYQVWYKEQGSSERYWVLIRAYDKDTAKMKANRRLFAVTIGKVNVAPQSAIDSDGQYITD